MRKLFVLGSLALATLGSVAGAAAPDAGDWEIGPNIRGKNYSVNMPLRPEPTRDGWQFDFPFSSRAAGHVHYVTTKPVPLIGKSRITVRYRVVAEPRTHFVPQEHPHLPGTVSLFLQRRGDNWSAKGRYALFRWYAPAHTVKLIAPGVHEMTVRLYDPAWTSVVGSKSPRDHPEAFEAALADPHQIGLVFGSTEARGHGVFATAPARFELLSFDVD